MANMHKIFAVIMLLVALVLQARAQPVAPAPPSKAQLDSVKQALRTSATDTSRVNQLLLLGRFYLAKFK
jgi:hypothetical protein